MLYKSSFFLVFNLVLNTKCSIQKTLNLLNFLGFKKIKQGLYYTNKNWIKEMCEQKFGKTEIILSSILPDDVLIIVQN